MNTGMHPDMPAEMGETMPAMTEEQMKEMAAATDGTDGSMDMPEPTRVTASTSWVLNGMIAETLTIEVTPGSGSVTPDEETAPEPANEDTDGTE
jgi:hypothetical protein